MNYRHIFHAGNFADVFKHIVLARVIVYMQKKDAAFRVLDTHAGLGLYDLSSEQAQKTGEWKTGIGKVMEAADKAPAEVRELLAPYIDAVRSVQPRGRRHAVSRLADDRARIVPQAGSADRPGTASGRFRGSAIAILRRLSRSGSTS
jgi:23S rRNA A2030 N6-methylase RlmJ